MIPGIVAGYPVSGGTPTNPLAASIYAKLTSWWEMTEASGTRSDSKGSNHLSVTGTVSTATGVRGGSDVAAAFAGAGALYASDSDSLSVPAGGGDHCMFGWAWFDSFSATQVVAAKWNAASSGSLEYALQYGSGSGNMIGQNGGSNYYNASVAAPSAGSWHFYTMWRDSTAGADAGKVRLQMDGGTIALSPSASNPSDTGNMLAFGRAGSSASGQLSGRVQRFGWIKGAILTADERAYLYNSGSGRTWAELVAAAGE